MANTKITTNVIADNAVGITQLNVSDGSNGQVLTTNGSGTLSFATVTGTTINNNADNRVITGSGTANTLEGEANFVFDGTNVSMTHAAGAHTNGLKIINSQAGGYGSAVTFQSERSDDNSIVSAAQIRTQGQDSWNSAASADSNLFFATALDGSLTDRMVIKHDGSVGVGTTSPTARLDVRGSVNSEQAVFTGASNSGRGLSLQTAASGGQQDAGVVFDAQDTENGANPFIQLKVAGNDVAKFSKGSDDKYPTSGGLGGIGGTGANLHLDGDDSEIRMANNLIHSDNSGNTKFTIRAAYGAVSTAAELSLDGGHITFNTGTSFAEKIRIDDGGRLLVNTDSLLTFGKLQVAAAGESAGHGGIVGFYDKDASVGSSNVIQTLSFTEDSDATGGVYLRFRDSNSILGQVTAANGTQCSYGVSSDERLKKNIVDASSQLNTIKNIKVREFDWKVNNYHEVGMIAQELNTIVPSVVQEGGDDIAEEPWTVDYAKLTPYLIKAIQEQQTIIEDLKTRIETLES
jgi:hypothetical protein